jgi:large subunit ribosomal protein L9
MQVILLQDVKALGKKGDMVTVNDGYAKNFIIPRKYGVEATNKNLNDLKLQKANDDKVAEDKYKAAQKLAGIIEAIEVIVKMRAGEGGKVFGSVSTKEIAKEVLEQHNLEIDKKKMLLAEPIKSFGIHVVPIKLHQKVTAELKVTVQEL